ncbi:NAD(P)-dependent oxidoreductase [Sulfolobus tengchongensis]|uniref:NAD(P)-dependent oxidoreductase n=1 Tax=Sulfolobus tengchongensis TaxID=207809 RepID=A0AAX4L5F4_9CREN
MRIALFGASGRIGQRILREALDRNHYVIAIVRDPKKITISNPKLTVISADIRDPNQVAKVVRGTDVVVASIRPDTGHESDLVIMAKSLIEGTKLAKVNRLIFVGGAGSLEVEPGKRLMDMPNFPTEWRAIAQAAAEALEVFKKEKELDWVYVSPPMFIEPGVRTGKYRIDTDKLIFDSQGRSYISMEDFAVAILYEIEKPRFHRQRFTVGY